MELVQVGNDFVWKPRKTAKKPVSAPSAVKTTSPPPSGIEPVVTAAPATVVDTPGITIKEYFGNASTKDSGASFAMATVHRADEAGWQVPAFAEYVLVTSGTLELLTVNENGADLVKTRVEAGNGVYLPSGLRAKWTWPEPCTYTVVCVPAYSPHTAGSDANAPDTVVDKKARASLRALHKSTSPAALRGELPQGITPLVVKPVAVVDAPGITIFEHMGNVASKDVVASLGRAVVKGPSQEAWQAPGFDEYVVCTKGAIDFHYEGGRSKQIVAGQGIFLPKNLRVKWVWPEATEYTVLCLPAFTPELCGREAEESATNAKDSASMRRLEEMHAKTRS